MRKRIGFDPFITFIEDDNRHDYFGADGIKYTSVSEVLKTYSKKFESAKISSIMCKGNTEDQAELLGKWDHKRNYASSYGKLVHSPLELHFKTGQVQEGFEEIIEDVKGIMRPYERVYPEFQFYSREHKVCGTSDLPFVRRTLRIDSVVYDQLDIGDYKTNAAHGIRYSGTYWKEGLYKHKGYLLGPLSHLEDCEYNKYAMQLSLYARMAEMEYLVKIGRLFLAYIALNGHVQHIPVPYMKYEADAVLDHFSNLQKIE